MKRWSSEGKRFERRAAGIVAKKEMVPKREYRKIIYSQGSGRQIEVIKLIGIMGSQSRGVRK
jgi:hypothetical protein